MRAILENHVIVLAALKFWAATAALTLATLRLRRCPFCRTSLRVDDDLGWTRRGPAHAECAAGASVRDPYPS